MGHIIENDKLCDFRGRRLKACIKIKINWSEINCLPEVSLIYSTRF